VENLDILVEKLALPVERMGNLWGKFEKKIRIAKKSGVRSEEGDRLRHFQCQNAKMLD